MYWLKKKHCLFGGFFFSAWITLPLTVSELCGLVLKFNVMTSQLCNNNTCCFFVLWTYLHPENYVLTQEAHSYFHIYKKYHEKITFSQNMKLFHGSEHHFIARNVTRKWPKITEWKNVWICFASFKYNDFQKFLCSLSSYGFKSQIFNYHFKHLT